MNRESINERIARLRKKNGLTQKELAEKIGIAPTLISDYERGKLRLYDELIVKIAEVFQVSTDHVLGHNVPNNQEDHPSRNIMKRLRKIESLPTQKKKTILKTLDDLIRANT
jgi:transcriptional regulator with XRE-family HTH domain